MTIIAQRAFATILLIVLAFACHVIVIGQIDGPTSVSYGDVYKRGELRIETFNLSELPPLPPGYVALNETAYKITTSASVSGPHVVHFKAPSVRNEGDFKKLRIFHVETDPYDPDAPVWRDRTILAAAQNAPDFSSGAINATSSDLGVFAIGRLVKEIKSNASTADLEVSYIGTLDHQTSPAPLNYKVMILNKGPDVASDVGLVDSLSGHVTFISVESSRGSCKERTGTIYCKIGNLKPGESASIAIRVQPYEGQGSFPTEGMPIVNAASASASERDPEPENNKVSTSMIVFPDPNLPPSVKIVNLINKTLLVGPAQITLKAIATDAEGSIRMVEFFDNGRLIGTGASTDGKTFALPVEGLSFGRHVILAVATDSGGRTNESLPSTLIVNGLAKVRVEPLNESVISPESNITLIATAKHPSGEISKVEFFANDQRIGEASFEGETKYRLIWKNVHRSTYSIVAVATDGSGVTTTSDPIRITVSGYPEVKLIEPSAETKLFGPTNLSIVAFATQLKGSITRVDFYANDKLLGSASDLATERFRFTWRGVQVGNYALRAVAVDDLGLTASSSLLRIQVQRRTTN